MKPFTTIEYLPNGQGILPIQLEGSERNRLADTLIGRSIVAYAVPDGQSLTSAWLLQLWLDSGHVMQFSASSTQVVKWKEWGTINVSIETMEPPTRSVGRVINVDSLRILKVEIIAHSEDGISAEAGIVLGCSPADDIVIAAGDLPGSISVRAPFSEGPFEPQFSEESYEQRAI